MKNLLICMLILPVCLIHKQAKMKEISKNNMTVRWNIDQEYLFIEMEAPTNGWVAIGFNETNYLTGTYLLMGHVKGGKAEVIEYYTSKPGSYKPITEYGLSPRLKFTSGTESGNFTRVKFAIPVVAVSKYHKNLLPGTEWTLLMAYSAEDDFQHHSTMRTSADITL